MNEKKSIHTLSEHEKNIFIMKNMPLNFRVSKRRLALRMGLEAGIFYHNSSRKGLDSNLWSYSFNRLVLEGYILEESIASEDKTYKVFYKIKSYPGEDKDLGLDNYTIKKKMSRDMSKYRVYNTKKEKKEAIMQALKVGEVVFGRVLAVRINIPKHYFAKSSMDVSKEARKWSNALNSLVMEGYLIKYPTKSCKIKKAKELEDSERTNFTIEELQEKVENMDYRGDSLSDRLSEAVENLLTIAKEVSIERVEEEHTKQMALKDAEIEELKKKLESKKKPSLLSFIK